MYKEYELFRYGLMKPVSLAAMVIAATLFIACGGDDDDDDHMAGESPVAMDTDMEHDEDFAFGHPGDAAEADRIIDIEATDSLRFEPDSVSVKVGETITFRVHNSGTNKHEFVLGTAEEQAHHEQEMQEMAAGSGMHMGDEPNGISLEGGETKEITWTFTEAGEMIFGCHEPAHYDAGMKGTITVS